jgi:hypothetical protein
MYAHVDGAAAPHGAGLTNIAFSKEGALAVQMFGPRLVAPRYYFCARSRPGGSSGMRTASS